MANTYSQIFIQFVFSVRNREPLIKFDEIAKGARGCVFFVLAQNGIALPHCSFVIDLYLCENYRLLQNY